MSPLIVARCGSISSEYVAEILLDEVPAVHVRDTHPGIFRMGISLPFDEILYIRIGIRLSVVQNCFHLVFILVQLLLLLSSSPLLGSLTPLRFVTPCIISTWVQPTRTCWGWRGH